MELFLSIHVTTKRRYHKHDAQSTVSGWQYRMSGNVCGIEGFGLMDSLNTESDVSHA